MSYTPDETLDCSGLSCPMPTLKTKKALAKLSAGQVLEMIGTDPGTKNDMSKLCEKGGHELLGVVEDGNVTKYYIKKG